VIVPSIPELADQVRRGCDADERDANRNRPQACPTCHQPVHEPRKLLDGIKYDCGHYFTWNRLFDLHEREERQATRVQREVASKRALLDLALSWRHGAAEYGVRYAPCEALADPPGLCDCGRDERVRAVLEHLAQPYRNEQGCVGE
jgi:hypothetical protein